MTDSQDYDLVIDDGTLKTVQVKTTRHKAPSGSYIANLSIKGGNQTFNTVKKFSKEKANLVFILTESKEMYLIPSNILGENHVTLGKKYEEYKVYF